MLVSDSVILIFSAFLFAPVVQSGRDTDLRCLKVEVRIFSGVPAFYPRGVGRHYASARN